VSLYIPLVLWSWVLLDLFGFVSCCVVLVLLNRMPIFVCWKRLVIFLIFGLWYVKIVHFLLLFPFFLDTGALFCVVFVLLDFL
jgi:hypothetical protein